MDQFFIFENLRFIEKFRAFCIIQISFNSIFSKSKFIHFVLLVFEWLNLVNSHFCKEEEMEKKWDSCESTDWAKEMAAFPNKERMFEIKAAWMLN